MSFNDLLSELEGIFRHNGLFSLCLKQSIKKIVKKSSLPKSYGVYVIYGCSSRTSGKDIIYIGKSGLVNQKGSMGKQTLPERLTNRQDGKSREDYFRSILRKGNYSSLLFLWFITFDNCMKLLPSKVEADLMQAYFDEFGCLPKYNKQY